MNYRKINQEELEDLTLENGRKLLLSVGYVEDGSYSVIRNYLRKDRRVLRR